MIRFIQLLTLVCFLSLISGCAGVSYSGAGFPWKMVGEGPEQEAANAAMEKKTAYYGNLLIFQPRRKMDSKGKPKKQKTLVKIWGGLREKQKGKEPTCLLEESFAANAYYLRVVERDGNETECNIILEDTADKEQWRISLTFDPKTKQLRIKEISPNLKKS